MPEHKSPAEQLGELLQGGRSGGAEAAESWCDHSALATAAGEALPW